ncbi:conserved hypothetical protein [Candidatus Sulfopaludibacter sp. SbA4]|nr:conserved hypothetical protein [Candidatus Sulfopaludibacter sp. SbA4]
MSQPSSNPFAASETSIRQLIANGKTKPALENAKEVHKTHGTRASEELLIDAYTARIQALNEQNLKLEAKSLLDLVRSRFPSAQARIDARIETLTSPARGLETLVASLTDPELAPEHRAAIEQRVQREAGDLAELAGCAALPADHPLRQAAAALLKAFVAVTTGPVAEDELALPAVSRRSPLAPWKLLVRAIGHFYRKEDSRARECLDAIPPESAPARLIPSLRAMLGDRLAAPLAPAAARLVSLTTEDSLPLRNALEKLDQALESEADDKPILQAAKAAVRECSLHAPYRLEKLKQHISVRCAMADLDKDRVIATIGGLRQDAYFYRLFARGMELTHDPEDLTMACGVWDEFREQAVKEGWFSFNGAEAATLYLHMTSVLGRLPDGLLDELHQSIRAKFKQTGELPYFLFPQMLYQRACTLDPHFEAFAQWMEWAKSQKDEQACQVAEAWHAIRPDDIDPILYLMGDASDRNLFPTALKYLARAERIDGVHPAVRRARLQFLAGGAIKYIQQKKPHLAEERLAEMAGLPQSQQGDRPAFLAALRYLAGTLRGDIQTTAAHRSETERLLGSKVGAALLIFGVATAAKRGAFESLEPPGKIDKIERAALPAAVARVVALAADMNAMKLQIPWSYIAETAKQLPRNSQSLDTSQLQYLAQAGLCSTHAELGYAATAAGLERGGPTGARFLLLRAKLLPPGHEDRRTVCAAAAAELGRQQRDMRLVEEAVELTRGRVGPQALTLTLEQAAEVLRKEKAAKRLPKHPGQGPSYRNLLPRNLCPCPTCRAQRGELVGDPYDEFEDDEFADDFTDEDFDKLDFEEMMEEFPLPPGVPPQIGRVLFEEAKKAAKRGESLDDLQSRLFRFLTGGGTGKKGRRR